MWQRLGKPATVCRIAVKSFQEFKIVFVFDRPTKRVTITTEHAPSHAKTTKKSGARMGAVVKSHYRPPPTYGKNHLLGRIEDVIGVE